MSVKEIKEIKEASPWRGRRARVGPLWLGLLAWACAAPPSTAPPSTRGALEIARRAEQARARSLKAALLRLDRAEEMARQQPSEARCVAVEAALEAATTAWAALTSTEQRLMALGATSPAWQAGRRRAVEIAEGGLEALDAQRAAWRGFCGPLQPGPLGPASGEIDAQPHRLGPDLLAYDALLIWRATPRALRGPRGAWRAARALAARLPPGPNVLLILAEIDPLDAYEAAALIGPGRYPAPPGWPQLRGVFVLEAKDGLSEGPSLHALARVVAPRLALGGPEEIDALQRRGYLITAATRGQLGGGLRCEAGACALPDGRARIASGGNAAPYSELELALMGLRPWAGLDEGLARLSMTPEGLRRTGEVTLEAIRAAAPPPPPAWRLGVVWISAKAPSEPEVQRQLRALEAFARPGPDADPLRYNFYEATQGRGRLRLHAWRG